MTVPVWQYQESDHPGADFDSLAEIYDRNMQKFRDIEGEVREILDFLDLSPDQSVLEIGTGTGEFAIAAAGSCARVYAVDLSAGMLRYAAEKARVRGVSNVEFLPGGFLTYNHQGAPVDAVVTQVALHHLPDFWKQIALLRMAEMLPAGGKLFLRDVVYSFDLRCYESSLNGYLARAREKMGPKFSQSIEAHVKREYSTLDWIMRGMIERAGFDVVREEQKEGFLGSYFCIKR